ncbi:hypothetical protein F2981_11180 [Sinorhizobium meliloti]|nr:hypothetical protein [Sinorhizobium meliloti]
MGEMHRFNSGLVAGVVPSSRIGEMPVTHHPRHYGSSKYGIARTFRVILDLLAVLFFMRYKARPGHFFGSIGLAAGVSSVLILLYLAIDKFIFGNDIGTRPMLDRRRDAVPLFGPADHHRHSLGDDGARLFPRR